MNVLLFFVYLFLMAGVTYLIRMLPFTFFKKKIKSRYLRSFLYYVPYVTLAVMTFPAILEATQSPISAAVALIAAIVMAWVGKGLFAVAVTSSVVVFVIELIMSAI